MWYILLWLLLFKSNNVRFAVQVWLVNQWLMVSTNRQLLKVTPVTFGFGATQITRLMKLNLILTSGCQMPLLNLRLLQNQKKSKVLKLSLRQQMLIVSSRNRKFDLGDALADSSTSTNQPAYNDALVDNIDDNNPLIIAHWWSRTTKICCCQYWRCPEPQASKPLLLDDATISDTIRIVFICTSTVAGVTGAKADEEKTTPKVSMTINRPSAKTESLQSLLHHRIKLPLMVTFQLPS